MCYILQCMLTDRVWGVRNDNIESILILLHELKTISNIESQLGAKKSFRHSREVLFRNVNDILFEKYPQRLIRELKVQQISLHICSSKQLEWQGNLIRTSSISHWTTDSTIGCFTTSLSTPPSPPPMIRTCSERQTITIGTIGCVCYEKLTPS